MGTMTPGTGNSRWLLLLLLFVCLFSQGESTICKGLTYYSANTTSQTFTSPDYPSNYGINVFCSWLIVASDSSHKVRLSVGTSSLENPDGSGSCSYDYGRAYEGNSMTTLLGDWCGDTTTTLTTTGNTMLVVFRSDYDTVSTGFTADFWSGTFPTVYSSKDYTVIIACSVSGFVLIVGIIIFCCVRSKLKRKKQKQQATDKERLPENEDVEANNEKYEQGGKAMFSKRIIPSSKGKRRQPVEVAVEPENTAVDRVTALNAAAAAAAKQKEEKEREKQEKKREKERKQAEEKAAKEEKRAKAAEEKRKAAEEKKLAAEKAAEEKNIAAAKAAEEKKKSDEEKKIAAQKAAEEKKVAAEKAAEEKKKAAEEKKVAAEKAAEERKKAAEEKKVAAEKAAEEKALAAEKAKEPKPTEEPKPITDKSAESQEKKTVSEEKALPGVAVAVKVVDEKPRPTTKQSPKKKVAFEDKPKEIEDTEPDVAQAVASSASGNTDVLENVILVQGMAVAEKSKSTAKGKPEPETKDKPRPQTKEKARPQTKEQSRPQTKEKPRPESKQSSKGNAKPAAKEVSKAKETQQKPKTEPKLTKEKSNVEKASKEVAKAAAVSAAEKPKTDKAEAKSSAKSKEPSTKEKTKEEKVAPKPTTPKPEQTREKSKPNNSKSKETSKPEKSAAKEVPKTPQSTAKETSKVAPITVVAAAATPAKESSKEKSKTEDKTKSANPPPKENATKPAAEESTKPKTTEDNSKPVATKAETIDKPAEKPDSKDKTKEEETQPKVPQKQPEPKTADAKAETKTVGGIAFGNKPGETTRPGSKVVMLPTVITVESAEEKKRKKVEDQWDKLSIARQDQISVHGGDVTPRVSTAVTTTQKKYQPDTAKVKEEPETPGKGGEEKGDGKRGQTSGSVASLEKDEGINMDYEGGDSGKSSPASRPTTMSPRDNSVVTPSVVNPSIVTSIINGTTNHQPVPIEAPSGGAGERPKATSPTRFSSPMEGSVEDIERRLNMAIQWPKAWTYKSQQFSEVDIKSELSMQRAKTSLGDHAGIHGAESTPPRPPIKGAFMSEGEKNNAIKNAVISTLAKPQGGKTDKVVPRGRNLVTR